MRTLYAGNGLLGLTVAKELLKSHHHLAAYLQYSKAHKSTEKTVLTRLKRNYIGFLQTKCQRVDRLLMKNNVPVIQILDTSEKESWKINEFEPDLLLVAGFPLKFSTFFLNIPKIGCINIHPSLLPEFRGGDPLSHIILNREERSGVTFHQMNENFDEGEIIRQVDFPVSPDETKLSLEKKTARCAAQQIIGLLDKVERNGIDGAAQDHTQATKAPIIKEKDLFIDWRKTVDEVEPMFRAFLPFMYPRFNHKNMCVKIIKATFKKTVIDVEPGSVLSTWPFPEIALADGIMIIRLAYAIKPSPMIWPFLYSPLEKGDVLG